MSQDPIQNDMKVLRRLLLQNVAPHLRKGASRDEMRMLDLACGRCDEAATLVDFAKEHSNGTVSLTGADIRIREILQARDLHAHLPAEFLLEDATKLHHHKEVQSDFDLVLLRHQNFWHGPELWKGIFAQGLEKLDDDGLLVITSYFDKEHGLALDALQKLGAELVHTTHNEDSRRLLTPGKHVDKHLAVFRKRKG